MTARACPLFVPLVENGRCHLGDPVVELVAAEYLTPLRQAGIDTLLMGCTHYPLLREVVGAFFGPRVALIDVGAACIRQVKTYLTGQDLLSERQEGGSGRYFVSDSVDGFARLASLFLGESLSEQVEQIDITSF